MAEETKSQEQHEPEEYLAVVDRFVVEDAEEGLRTCYIFFDGPEEIAPFPNEAQRFDEKPQVELMLVEDLAPWINDQDVNHVVLTGGEPLKQGMCCSLIANLSMQGGRLIEVETNGISQIDAIAQLRQSMTIMSAFSATSSDDMAEVAITMDHWLPGTEPLAPMTDTNFALLEPQDTVRFIAATEADLAEAERLCAQHNLDDRCTVEIIKVEDGEEPCDCHEHGEECHCH